MRYLIDTNIISETMKPKADPNVLLWMADHQDDALLSVITIEELRFGELMMPRGKKRAQLNRLIDTLITSYAAKTLPFDTASAELCAAFHERAITAGRTPTIEDLMIAAIATTNGCTLATRNVKDFDYLDIPLVNPFTPQ